MPLIARKIGLPYRYSLETKIVLSETYFGFRCLYGSLVRDSLTAFFFLQALL